VTEQLNAWQVCKAANVTRAQLNQWLVRGHFKPQHEPEVGKSRTYSLQEAVTLGAFAELIRLGIPHEVAAQNCKSLHGFTDEAALLVVYQGPVELIAPSERGAPLQSSKKGVKFYDPDQPHFSSDIIRLSQLAAYAANRDVRSLAVVNLDHVEARAKSALQSPPEKSTEAAVTHPDGGLADGSTKRRRKR
jgi:hypothetical protein